MKSNSALGEQRLAACNTHTADKAGAGSLQAPGTLHTRHLLTTLESGVKVPVETNSGWVPQFPQAFFDLRETISSSHFLISLATKLPKLLEANIARASAVGASI